MSYWMALAILILSLGQPPSIATAQTVQEVRIRWDAYIGAPAPHIVPGTMQASNVFTLLDRRQVAGSVPYQRNPELSADHLVVVGVDARGQEVYSQVIPDPRILRAEVPGPSGELSGQVFHYASTELLIALPDDVSITALRLYHPRWTGKDFVLDPLATIPL